MFDKSTTKVANPQQHIHRLPAGILQGDFSTEIFGCRDSKKLFALSNGQTIPFSELKPDYISKIYERLLNDEKAIEDLKHLSQVEAIDQYVFCLYGSADDVADFSSNGELNEPTNFICTNENCRCLNWNSKKITINGEKLTPRQIEIIRLLATDMCDKMIANQLGICISTLDTHKKTIFEKAGVSSKNGLIVKAINEKIIQ